MTSINCPICSGPLELRAAAEGSHPHSRTDPTAEEGAQEEVAHALQAALRALEDQAAGARWRLSQPSPPPLLEAQLERSNHHIELLHSLLRNRPDA